MCDAMKNKFYRSIFAAMILALLSAAALAQSAETQYKELPNFHQVNTRLYRGGQPKAGGIKKLSALGVKTVINLRGDDEHAGEEEREAKSLGMNFFKLPLSLGGRPSREQIARALALINTPENQPVFVHCHKGADRTGVVVAAYRITHDHWTAQEAQREADRYGMGWWQHGKKDFISDYYRDQGGATSEGTNPNTNRKANQNANPKANQNTKRRDKPSPAATKH
ncbi:MAG: tyrosine-protein phosphatase [Acidobacteriota bacterium]|jgi:protein tyrosine/serine phosphatase|nr:tyrosine-protein phosphatase [Acidobacteriota bacterium]